eukprot:SAG22_NODE_21390_length_257_cov_0.968354_1_plen_35_part_10
MPSSRARLSAAGLDGAPARSGARYCVAAISPKRPA